ncbi:ribosomal protein S18 acetylase RimI-like enzyme [Methanomicrobium sp. W14]|uniref:GNAT family N-acetyltransferase n=1 Tax=Methanomicrobium sp. W14 TaxID=2817839 RepID=UPI001AE8FB78|nr:GNAT family N-acetyltransferase [Methanomicrobium sp. W14]MBP2132891.1 ribosomal protein S18 acetylase RimI-like enzyme [Methanomicrobium sp. W14]
MSDICEIEVRFVKDWPEDEIVNLYREGKWWDESWKSDGISDLIKGSFIFAIAIDMKTKTAVGMGRIISDGVSDGYIQDLVIKKDFRSKGIGRKLLNSLVEEARSGGLTWIGLIAEPDTENFYKSEGFSVMKDHTPMIYGN